MSRPPIIDQLASEGGHIAILFCLIVLGAILYKLGIAKGEDIIVGSAASLYTTLKLGGKVGSESTTSSTSEKVEITKS